MAEPPPFRERLSWDAAPGEIRDGAVRYMMIRPDALMAMFARLEPEPRRTALAALGDAVLEFGSRSATVYARTATVPLLDIVARTAPDLGWGEWIVGYGDALPVVEVRSSPFASGIGRASDPVCTPITGMLSAVLGLMHGGPVTVRETTCAAITGETTCRFEMTGDDRLQAPMPHEKA